MATKYGTGAADTIGGTSSADTLWGRGGDDTLKGLGGADKLYGEAGDDTLHGGAGNDLLAGGAGRDKAEYKDVAVAGPYGRGIDASLEDGTVTVADGRDTLRGVEDVNGTRFADFIVGSDGANVLGGGAGVDQMEGRGGADRLYGSLGVDYLNGGDGADRLYGGDGDDQLYGDAGADRLEGYTGHDFLEGGGGDDVLEGGAGIDRFAFKYFTWDGEPGGEAAGGRDVVADFVKGQDRLVFNISPDDGPYLNDFSDFDSNRNGVLDDGDTHVEVESVTHGGVAKQSTVIDWSPAMAAGHEGSAVIYGVTGLAAGDFTSG